MSLRHLRLRQLVSNLSQLLVVLQKLLHINQRQSFLLHDTLTGPWGLNEGLGREGWHSHHACIATLLLQDGGHFGPDTQRLLDEAGVCPTSSQIFLEIVIHETLL